MIEHSPVAVPSLTTARLTLREMTQADVPALHLVTGDAAVMKWYVDRHEYEAGWSLAETADFVTHCADVWARRGMGRWAIEHAGQVIGYCGLSELDYLPEGDSVELSYRIRPDFWGRGLVPEAASAALSFGFDQGLDAIAASIVTKNVQSARVAAKLGMVVVAEHYYLSSRSGRGDTFQVHRISRAGHLQRIAS